MSENSVNKWHNHTQCSSAIKNHLKSRSLGFKTTLFWSLVPYFNVIRSPLYMCVYEFAIKTAESPHSCA